MKKAQASSKANVKFKREAKDKERDIHKMRKEIIDLKHQNAGLGTQLKDIKNNQPPPARGPPKAAGQSSGFQNNQQATQIRFL